MELTRNDISIITEMIRIYEPLRDKIMYDDKEKAEKMYQGFIRKFREYKRTINDLHNK